MNKKIGLYVTRLVYVTTVLGILYAFISPTIAHTGLWKGEIVVEFEKPVPVVKTLNSEIDRLSKKYSVSSYQIHAIIHCESQLYGGAVNKNYDKNGVLWSTDFGYLQINDWFHKEDMDKLGLNIYNEWDSLEYGFILFKQQGFAPWSASKACWSKLIK